MRFSTFLALALFCAGGAVTMLAASGNPWVQSHTWLLTLLRWGAGICTVLAVLSTKTANRIWMQWAISEKHPNQKAQKAIQHATQGQNRPTCAADHDVTAQTAGRDIVQIFAQPAAAKASAAPRSEAIAAVPNLEYVDYREKTICVDQSYLRDAGREDIGAHVFPSVILRFENRLTPERRIARAPIVIAKLTLSSTRWLAPIQICNGMWLNEGHSYATMEVGQTCELVLLLLEGQGANAGVRYFALEDRRHIGKPLPSQPWSYFNRYSADSLETVEVTLIDQASQETRRFKFGIAWDGYVCVVRQL